MVEPLHGRNASEGLDDAAGLQDFPRQPGNRELGDAINRDPLAFRGGRSTSQRRIPQRRFPQRHIPQNMNRVVGNGDGMAKRAPVRGSRQWARRLGGLGEFPHAGHERGFPWALDEADATVALG